MDRTDQTTESYVENQTPAANQLIVGYFDDQGRAERALAALRDAGFGSANIGLAHHGAHRESATAETRNSAEDMWLKIKGFFESHTPHHTEANTARQTAPVANEPAAQAYSDDDLHGSLTDLGLGDRRARYFSRRMQTADYGAVVTVNATDRANVAEFILRDHGADLGENIVESDDYVAPVSTAPAPAPQRDYSAPPPATAPAASVAPAPVNPQPILAPEPEAALPAHATPDVLPPPTDVTTAPAQPTAAVVQNAPRSQNATETQNAPRMQNLQLLGEVLRVHKERIDRGEVRVRKEAVTETQTIQVPVTREELVIEQRPKGGDAAAPGQEIRIPISQEKASVDKQTVVREDVAVGKKPVQEMRELQGDVRHEELVVDDRTKRAVNE